MFEISRFGLKNFRVFKDFTEFDLSPVMVLTGPNNSGKSSLIKALLLLCSNEDVINNIHSEVLKYIGGNHFLGSHKLTINKEGENTLFSFTFLNEYRLIIEVNNKGELVYNYKIVDKNNEIVIVQDPTINVNFPKLITYFEHRVSDIVIKIENEDLGYENLDFDKSKIDLFINKLKEYDFDDIDFEFDPYESSDLDEDTVDLYWYKSILYLLKRVSEIELSKEEILLLIPFADSGYFRFREIYHIPTIREHFKRAYSESDSNIIRSLIKSRLLNKSNWSTTGEISARDSVQEDENKIFWSPFSRYVSFIQKWIYKFEIGKAVSFGYEEGNDTYYINIDGKSLLEYGAGYGQIIYLLFALENEIRDDKREIVKDPRFFFPRTYILEEPETSLHPAFQSKLAEMIVDAQKTFGVNFIIETHSEYMIRKFQYLTANKVVKVGDIGIYYFHLPNKTPENEKQIKKIDIDESGGLSDDFGPGFIDEATNLKYDLIRLNKNNKN